MYKIYRCRYKDHDRSIKIFSIISWKKCDIKNDIKNIQEAFI